MGRRTKERADDDCRSNDCHKHHDIIDGVDYYYRCKDHTKLLPDGKLCHNDQQCKSGNCHKHPPKRGEKDYENKCKPRTKSAALFAAPTNLASHSTKQFKLRGSDDLCLGVEDHHNVYDGTPLIMYRCDGERIGQGFKYERNRLKYDGLCVTRSSGEMIKLEECDDYRYEEEQTIELEYDSQYTDNIKFPYSDDLCLSGSNNDKHKVFAEPCGRKHQHWSF